MVENWARSSERLPAWSGTWTQAVTWFLWTSSAQQRSRMRSIIHLLGSTERASSAGARCSKILLGVLLATVRCAVGSPAPLLSDSRYQNVKRPRVDDRPSLAHFIRRV